MEWRNDVLWSKGQDKLFVGRGMMMGEIVVGLVADVKDQRREWLLQPLVDDYFLRGEEVFLPRPLPRSFGCDLGLFD